MSKELLEQTRYLAELLQLFLKTTEVNWFELEGNKEGGVGLSLGIGNSTVGIYIEEGKLIAVLETPKEIRELEFGLGDLIQVFSEISAQLRRSREV